MNSDGWNDSVDRELARLRERHVFRQRRIVRSIDATHIEVDGQSYVNFASNNYLGLTHHPRVIDAAADALRRCGAGSGAAGLITGYGPPHESAERKLAAWKGTESAVLLPSGYQANAAAVQTLATVSQRIAPGAGARFLLDKRVHASLIDAVRLTAAPYRVFPHNEFSKLGRLLSDAPAGQAQVVVTESIFSMDGDAADLRTIAELKSRHGFMLLLDEAHASGVYGEGGAGLAGEAGLGNLADVTVVTLSKGLGSAGGAVCASQRFCDAVVNFGRAYIYSTQLPSSAAAAAEAAIDVMRDEPERQRRVRELAIRVRRELVASGLAVPAGDSPIIPIVLGNERAALEAARVLQDYGLWTLAIRPPTVAPGTCRLRVTLCCEHRDNEVARLVAALRALRDSLR